MNNLKKRLILGSIFIFYTIILIPNNKNNIYYTHNLLNTVYICTGPKAKAYHSTLNCRGLSKCSSDIKTITLTEAKKIKRRACKICCKKITY